MSGTNTTTAVSQYQASFAAAAPVRALEPAWLQATRERAAGAFGRLGFPTVRDEDWRFTNVSPIAEARFVPADAAPDVTPAERDAYLVPGLAGPVLVFVDGRFAPGLSTLDKLPPGLVAANLAAAPAVDGLERHLAAYAPFDQRSFTSLNTALFPDAAVIEVPPHVVIEETIQLLFLSSGRDGTATFPRALVLAGEDSQVRIVESYASLSDGRSLTDAVTELVAGPAAVVDHYRLQRESPQAYHVGLTQASVSRSANVSSHSVTLGALISRHDATVVLAGEGAGCTLNGVYVGDGQRLLDNHTEVDHAMPNGTSHELYKGILTGKARGVFNGRIRVRPDAQKTDAKQTNKTLLLSNDAQVNTKPQLEIFANDVKCTHGATVGQLSGDALFYLRSRGIGLADARSLLVKAFAGEVTGRMKLDAVRELVDRLVVARLEEAGAGR